MMRLDRLNKNPVAWYTTGTIIRQLTAFLMLPVYTQNLTPAEYGIVAFLAVILGVYELFLGARFGMSVPKFYYDETLSKEKHSLITSALLATGVSSLFGAIIFSATSPWLSESFFERPDLTFAIMSYGVLLLTSSVEEYSLVFLRLKNKPFFFFVLSVFKLLMQLTFNLYFLLVLNMGVEGVIYGNILASIVLAIISGAYTFNVCGWHWDLQKIKALVRFTWPMWLGGIAAIYIQFMTNFVLKYFATLEQLGLFHFGQKFATLIPLLFWRPFHQWWQTERFRVAKEHNNPKEIFSAMFFLILSIMCLGIFGVSAFAGSVIELMADPSYMAAATIIPILCFNAVLSHVGIYFNFSILKTGRTDLFPKVRFAKAFILTILLWVFASQWQVYGVAFAIALAFVLEVSVYYIASKRLYDQGISPWLTICLLVLTAIGVSIVIFFVSPIHNFWIRNGYNVLATCVFLSTFAAIVFYYDNHGKTILSFFKKD